MIRLSASALALFLLSSALLAQERVPTVAVFGSYLTPLGKYGVKVGENAGVTRRFGFDVGEEAGLSGPGVGFGLEFRTPVLAEGLEWIISLQGLTNPVKTMDVTQVFREQLGDSVNLLLDTGSWFHIPLFTGLTYSVGLGENARLLTTLQAGVNVTREAPRTVKVNGVVVEETSFRFMPDFGFEAGIGIALFGSYELMVRYLDLGTPRYEGTRVLNEHFFTTIPRRENAISGDSRPVKVFLISVGYTL